MRRQDFNRDLDQGFDKQQNKVGREDMTKKDQKEDLCVADLIHHPKWDGTTLNGMETLNFCSASVIYHLQGPVCACIA